MEDKNIGIVLILVIVLVGTFVAGYQKGKHTKLPSSKEAALRAETILFNGSYAYLSGKWRETSINNYLFLYENYRPQARMFLQAVIEKVCYSPTLEKSNKKILREINHSCIEVCSDGFS